MSFICHFVIRRLLGLYEMNSTENLYVLTNYITKIIKKKLKKLSELPNLIGSPLSVGSSVTLKIPSDQVLALYGPFIKLN